MKSIKIKGLLAAIALLPLAANAAPIEGNIGIGGAIIPVCSGPGTCTMGVATGLDYVDDQGLVLFATGDFAAAGIVFGNTTAMQDFTFNPFGGVDPLWAIAGFSFALETLSVADQNNTFLEMRGTGTISGPGFDDTFGRWSFSADRTGSTFAWSSTTLAPEPGILMLLGLGLIGGLGVRRLARS